MHETSRQRKTAACVLPVQRYANLLVVLYSRLLNTLSFRLQHHTASSNASNSLNYMASNVVKPDLETHTYMHAGELCKKVILLRLGQKTKFLILACILQFRTKSVITESWTAWQWVNNAIDPATAASSIWIEKPTKHIYMTSRMTTTASDVICLATSDTKHLYHAYSDVSRV